MLSSPPAPVRTLHVLRYDARGGLEVSTLHLIEFLLKQRSGEHAVLLLSPIASGISARCRELGLDVRAVPYTRSGVLRFAAGLVRAMREAHPDVLLIHGCFGLHAIIAAAARCVGVRRVWTFVVNRPPPSGGARVVQQAMAHLARALATGEIGVSQHVRDALVDEYRLRASRVHVVYRWRDLARIERVARDVRMRRAPGPPVFGTIGRLDWMKDHQTVLRGFSLLRQALGEARLVIVGEGSDRAPLATLAASLGVAADVEFAGHRGDVAAELGRFDMFLFATSIFEGLPNVLVEAMAARVPVVCTDVGPCAEVLADGRAGVLVPPRDPAALARAGVALWRDEPRRTALVRTAAAWVERNFSAGAAGPALLRLVYPEVAARMPEAATGGLA